MGIIHTQILEKRKTTQVGQNLNLKAKALKMLEEDGRKIL